MKIELSETEIIHIMDSLRLRCQDLRDCHDAESTDLANELEDLEHDLFEASARPADWTEDLEPTEIAESGWSDPDDPDLFMDPVAFAVKHDAETQMFNAGVEAREQVKATSQAAARRDFNLRGPDPRLSATQRHDLWADADTEDS